MEKLTKNLKKDARKRIKAICAIKEGYTFGKQDPVKIMLLINSPIGQWLVNRSIPNKVILENALTGTEIHLTI